MFKQPQNHVFPMCCNGHANKLPITHQYGEKFPDCSECGQLTVSYCRHGRLYRDFVPCCVYGPGSWLPCGMFANNVKLEFFESLAFTIKCNKCDKYLLGDDLAKLEKFKLVNGSDHNVKCPNCEDGILGVMIARWNEDNLFACCVLHDHILYIPMPENSNWAYAKKINPDQIEFLQ